MQHPARPGRDGPPAPGRGSRRQPPRPRQLACGAPHQQVGSHWHVGPWLPSCWSGFYLYSSMVLVGSGSGFYVSIAEAICHHRGPLARRSPAPHPVPSLQRLKSRRVVPSWTVNSSYPNTHLKGNMRPVRNFSVQAETSKSVLE